MTSPGALHVAPVLHLGLPIGFLLTFQADFLLVDVYRKDVAPERNSFCSPYTYHVPHLVAGPLSGSDIVQDSRETAFTVPFQPRREYLVSAGAKSADRQHRAATADAVFALPASDLTTAMAWLGIVSYTSDYSTSGAQHMAIGLAHDWTSLSAEFELSYLGVGH